FPAGTTMTAELVQDNKKLEDSVTETLKKVAGEDETGLARYQAVDIRFFDNNDQEILPEQRVDVRITSEIVNVIAQETSQYTAEYYLTQETGKPDLFHLNWNKTTGDVSRAELYSAEEVQVQDEFADDISGNENTACFTTGKDGVFVIAEAGKIDENGSVVTPATEGSASGRTSGNAESGEAAGAVDGDGEAAGADNGEASGTGNGKQNENGLYVLNGGTDDQIETIVVTDDMEEQGEAAKAGDDAKAGSDADAKVGDGEDDQTEAEAAKDGEDADAEGKLQQAAQTEGDQPRTNILDKLIEKNNKENNKDTDENKGAAGDFTIPVEGASYRLHISYTKESGIPEDAEFRATAINENRADYAAYYDRARAAVNAYTEENSRAKGMPGLFDLTIYAADGTEIQPDAPLSVSIDLGKTIDEKATGVYAVHFPGTGADTVMPALAGDPVSRAAQVVNDAINGNGAEVIETTGNGGEVQFEAESLSVYAIVYTVDFTYEVDGKTFFFSMEGGSSIDIKDLIQILGIVADEKEATEFVKEIADVTFSNPELIKVTHKQKVLGIFGSDTWVLESLQPFDTEESLTITMKMG
ncbi:MAG: hypothetical protein IJ239_01890, partial [Eubacterium sp.]|nr:hypothetical protein [Eubacterium sp.]